MLGQIGGFGVDVLSGGAFSAMLLAILVGGAVYLAASLPQGRASFQTESVRTEPGSARAENSVLRRLHALALAVLVAAFVGFGIETFYPPPESPEDADISQEATPPVPSPGDEGVSPGVGPTPGIPDGSGLEGQVGAYEQQLVDHDRVTSAIATAVAVLILVAGVIFFG